MQQNARFSEDKSGEILGDPRFFTKAGPFSLDFLASSLKAETDLSVFSVHKEKLIKNIAPLHSATATDISFLDNKRYLEALKNTRAGAVILHPDLAQFAPEGTVVFKTMNPYLLWARVARLFYPVPPVQGGIHPTAVISSSANIDPSAEIGPFTVIEAGTFIGPRVKIAPFAFIGQGTVIGADTRIGQQASVSHAVLGERVYIYPGAKIGQDGFGFAITPQGFETVPQLGRVLIGHDVEIGANTTVDRGSASDTVIGDGTRIDNLVQIAHNVQIGRCCVIVSQVGISGSVRIDDQVMIGGQAGLTGHLHIGRGAKIGAQSGVMNNVPAGAEVFGSPAAPIKEYLRQLAFVRRLFLKNTQNKNLKTGKTL